MNWLLVISCLIICLIITGVNSKSYIHDGDKVNSIQIAPFYGGLTIEGTNRIVCSGFFYRPDIFISLANCQGTQYQVTDLLVYAGTIDRRDCTNNNNNCAKIKIKTAISHEQFNKNTLDNDIGIYLLQTNITNYLQQLNNNNVKLNTLDILSDTSILTKFNSTKDLIGLKGNIVGWGRENSTDETSSNSLNHLSRNIVSDNNCKQDSRYVSSKMKCVEGGACLGDGGSPLFIEVNGTNYAVAIYNFPAIGNNKDQDVCSKTTFQSYLNLIEYKNWIDSTVVKLRNNASTLSFGNVFIFMILSIVFIV